MADLLTEPALSALFGLLGGIILGLAARLGRFCTLGAIEDLLYGGSSTRMRMWGLAIGTAMIGTFALSAFGRIDLASTIYHGPVWSPALSIIGGLMFGYGMALAGNCGFGALARLGGGDLRSFVIVLVMGVAAYATLSGPLVYMRLWAQETTGIASASLGYAGLISGSTGVPLSLIGLLIGAAITATALASRSILATPKAIFWGCAVGIAIMSGWWGTAWINATGFDQQPVVSHTFSAPMGYTLLYLMTSSGTPLIFGVGSVAGVLCGAFMGSLIKGHFRWEACEDPRELKRQILGAALMGVGAVLALGCTVGQGISAFSVLSFSAPLVFISILAGAALGLRQLISGFRVA